MAKHIIKSIVILLIIIGITQLIGHLEIQHYDYKFKNEGIEDYGSSLIAILLIIAILLVSYFFICPRKWLKEHDFICGMTCFALSSAIALTMHFHVHDTLYASVTEALKDSYIANGHITHKDKYSHNRTTTYRIWAGINDSTTSRHVVDKNIYQTVNVGDTVILKVSKQYPCINEVLSWEPNADEIAKYRK
ncbi:MAG: hypothetical protein J6X05_08520 [Bacteroidales bacterium]|nr:hypothetical protein [Bacteroidales bacterium]